MALHKHGKEQEVRQETEFLRSLAEHKEDSDIIFVKNRSRLIRVKNEDLLFVRPSRTTWLCTTSESYTIHSTMKDVETKLSGSDFMRAPQLHRQHRSD